MSSRRKSRLLLAVAAGWLGVLLACAPTAVAATDRPLVPVAFLGLPSLHSIIEAIAKGFFSALAGALVPGFLKHGTVATIQHLVALPDPASWGHVSELEGDMTYLGMSLMPVTLAVCTFRYWMLGLTGAAHPVTALVRCCVATGVLVIYRWIVEQTVAATNTLTHAILAFPVVSGGLASIISVLFGAALLTGAGGVFGAFLVIVGVVFAAALFASAEALTVLLALVFCAGPPLIALAPIPELSHLARAWSHALFAIALVPIGWTILFAVAGALTLDATSFRGGASGLPAHIAAAFAGLITFVIAVKLPLVLFGELRQILGGALRTGAGSGGASAQSQVPGAARARAAQARLRSLALEGVPSLGRSVGRAAGAVGAPEGGPLGAARRGLAGAAQRAGAAPRVAAALGGGAATGGVVAGGRVRARSSGGGRGRVRERMANAGAILANAPREARAAMSSGSRRAKGTASHAKPRAGGAARKPSSATGKRPARVTSPSSPAAGLPATSARRSAPNVPASRRGGQSTPPGNPAGARTGARPVPASGPSAHPGQKVTRRAQRETSGPTPPQQGSPASAKHRPTPRPKRKPGRRSGR
jgi:hypothetical protein